ncbi:MAG: IS4 family transposase [Alphaproteobacteria bacterium]|nr:IS4 family transposase [Alphaproteobacteria bacterium]
MRHYNTVFHGLTKHLPWGRFDRLADAHRADFRVRTLSAKSHFVSLLFGQLSGADSLRAIEDGLGSHAAKLYHLGAAPVARSTLADANASRPSALFADLFADMVAMAGRQMRRKLEGATLILDATRLKLSSLNAAWASAQNGKHAAKLHLVYDPDADLPLSVELTSQNVNDITPAKARPICPGATYVFDLAYYDYKWWADLHAHGCRVVTRLKRNTQLEDRRETAVVEGSAIVSDATGLLPRRQASSRKNPFAAQVREIAVKISSGKIIRIVTNDLKAPATEIADLYKQRWEIELFFKWLKQNLKIRHFLGTSENAVRIQVFVALIAYILLRLARTAQSAIEQPLKFARLIRLNLMHRRSIQDLERPPPDPRTKPNQSEFCFDAG